MLGIPLLLALATPSAHAACTLSALSPASNAILTTRSSFMFLMTTDCTTSSFTVAGVAGTTTPSFIAMVGGKQRMLVSPSAATWAAWTGRTKSRIAWTVTATDATGVSTSKSAVALLDLDADGYTRTGGDVGACDASAAIHPGVAETCDHVDNDCNGTIDEGVTSTLWRDVDGDGHGSTTRSVVACTGDAGLAAVSDDCDDGDAGIFPGQVEHCYDGVDEDCDGSPTCIVPSQTAELAAGALGDADAVVEWDDDLDDDGNIDDALGALGYVATELHTCDFNGDGILDVLAGPGYQPWNGYIYRLILGPLSEPVKLNDAAATFTTFEPFHLPSATCGDVTGDGLADVILGVSSLDPAFDPAREYAGAVSVFAGPLSGDYTIEDATATIVGVPVTGTYTSFSGDNHFGTCGTYESFQPLDFGRTVVFAGDYDGDGIGDLAVSELGYQTASAGADWYDASGNVCHTTSARLMAPTLVFLGPITSDRLDTDAEGVFFGAVPVGTADVDSDGRSDIVLRPNYYSPTYGAPVLNFNIVAGGTFGVGYPEDVALASIAADGAEWLAGAENIFPGQIALGDFDADGIIDFAMGGESMIFLQGPLVGAISVSADATASFSAPIDERSYGPQTYTITPVGDVDGDGFPDALVTNGNGASQPYAFLVPGPIIGALGSADALGSFNSTSVGGADTLVRGAPLGDWNGDGRDDLLLGGWRAAYVIHGE